MISRFFILSFSLFFMHAFECIAGDLDLSCEITPQIWGLEPPPNPINKTNNLRIDVGSPYFASGQFIRIDGRVLDSACIPVSGAAVIIWQAPADHNTKFVRSGKFLGSGTATTDNLGNFTFFTVMPGKAVPHINFKVDHRDFGSMETKMFFPNYKNDINPDFNSVPGAIARKLLIAQLQKNPNVAFKASDYVCGRSKNFLIMEDSGSDEQIYHFTITLDGYNIYRK